MLNNHTRTLSVSTIFLPSLSHSQDNGLLLIVEWSNYCHVLCPGCTVGAAGILLTVVLTETRDTAHCCNHHTPVRCGRTLVSHSQTPPWTTLSCTVGTQSKYFSDGYNIFCSGVSVAVSRLRAWCDLVTSDYAGLGATDPGDWWRSGLGLCAIIARFRPDLIHYHSLGIVQKA